MSYPIGNYPRQPQAQPIPHAMHQQRMYQQASQYPQQQSYYYPSNQQYIHMQQNVPQYQMVQYPQVQQPAQMNYIPDPAYLQQMKMATQQPQQPVQRYPQQQVAYAQQPKKKVDLPAPPPQPAISSQVSTPVKQPQPQYAPKQFVAPQPAPQQIVQPKQQIVQAPSTIDTTSLAKAPNQPQIHSSIPPGCFNIISRGNIPGITFSHICTDRYA
ncbi:hypothetical protein TVAG_410010 [Trichomonas vaginalis G3]|uniref:Uncharacterized protein n=1 Tax=Trichomonas vaginalis (strain ATCC PRA-98 / G3) TaxID=412133 RepID=A2E8H1_TRIV3|nr:hypothetical protein TVAGG3_0359080 [Trichomonas vaginalis G3]EAY11008.1 hypothetical protein TVAG_410010 [Trichomonas vaginalis G3]KAI5531818.1 hypothetical protein TVAGG3_0359080 [Trichomonas vaginalis G3]|eukprot:XP_001323231.1 hypothetical protein [Trichomonas vaginalis G3]